MHKPTSSRKTNEEQLRATTTRHVDAGGSYEFTWTGPKPRQATRAARHRPPSLPPVRRAPQTPEQSVHSVTNYYYLPGRGVHVRHASAAGQTQGRGGRAAASGHGGSPSRREGGTCQPQPARLQEERSSTRGWTSCRWLTCGNCLAGHRRAKVSVHVRRPPVTVGRGNKTRERDFIHELGIKRTA